MRQGEQISAEILVYMMMLALQGVLETIQFLPTSEGGSCHRLAPHLAAIQAVCKAIPCRIVSHAAGTHRMRHGQSAHPCSKNRACLCIYELHATAA